MKAGFNSKNTYYAKNKFIPRLILVLSISIIIVLISFFSYKIIYNKLINSNSVTALYTNWNLHTIEGTQNVYNISKNILNKNPFNNAALTFHGFSAYLLAESETDNSLSQNYLSEAIFNLRCALQNCRKDAAGQIEYILGCCYFYKNKILTYHYYADSAIKYLLAAQNHGYKAEDIPLLLGLSYADINETDLSISAFTEALLIRESDTLLFNIAKQYIKNSQKSVAKQYLNRVLLTSSNEDLLNKSQYMLGQIALEEGRLEDAEAEFNKILEKNSEFADAYYGLGLIFEKKNDIIKARSEWKKCLKLQYNHEGALQKMSEKK